MIDCVNACPHRGDEFGNGWKPLLHIDCVECYKSQLEKAESQLNKQNADIEKLQGLVVRAEKNGDDWHDLAVSAMSDVEEWRALYQKLKETQDD